MPALPSTSIAACSAAGRLWLYVSSILTDVQPRIAVTGILMERYRIDRHRAFAFLTRNSQTRNIKVRVLAKQIIDGTFVSTPGEDSRSQRWP